MFGGEPHLLKQSLTIRNVANQGVEPVTVRELVAKLEQALGQGPTLGGGRRSDHANPANNAKKPIRPGQREKRDFPPRWTELRLGRRAADTCRDAGHYLRRRGQRSRESRLGVARAVKVVSVFEGLTGELLECCISESQPPFAVQQENRVARPLKKRTGLKLIARNWLFRHAT